MNLIRLQNDKNKNVMLSIIFLTRFHVENLEMLMNVVSKIDSSSKVCIRQP